MNVYELILNKLNCGENVVLCTVISTEGSVPGKKGAWMLISQGEAVGTIGGGQMEYSAINEGRSLLKEGKSCIRSLELRPEGDVGMICGGSVTLFFRFVDSGSKAFLEEATLFKNKKILTRVKRDMSWEWFFEGNDTEPSEGDIVFSERPYRNVRAVIFGGGHVSVQVVRLISELGFSVTVFEDRPEFAQRERFIGAENVILGDFSRISQGVQIEEEDFVLIMTRGHTFDYEVVRQVLPLNPYYMGVMGSKRKARNMVEGLCKEGFSKEVVHKIFSPVGLPIGAETPEEIAVSIASQMILERSRRK